MLGEGAASVYHARGMIVVQPCPPALVEVSRGHLILVCGERSQDLPFLPLGHVEGVQRSAEFSRDFVELSR